MRKRSSSYDSSEEYDLNLAKERLATQSEDGEGSVRESESSAPYSRNNSVEEDRESSVGRGRRRMLKLMGEKTGATVEERIKGGGIYRSLEITKY